MLPRKSATERYFIFPHQLTTVSTLPGETGNPKNLSCLSNTACCFIKKNYEINLKYPLVTAESPLAVKISTVHAPSKT